MKSVSLGGGMQLHSSDLTVKFKKLSPSAVAPKFGKVGDAGADLTAVSMEETEMYIEYGTGIAIEIPEGYVGLVYPRSSLSNYDLILSNHVGVIDSNYRGEIKFRFKKTKNVGVIGGSICEAKHLIKVYEIGNKIGQIIIQKIPEVTFEEVEELGQTNRGEQGYGSSGK